MIWSKHSGYGIHCDIVNPKLFELEAAKEVLAELYGMQIWGVEGLIGQHIVDFRMIGMEFGLYTSTRRLSLS